MKQTFHLIVLRTVRHNERHDILTAYTLEGGRMAFAVNAGRGRSASRARALLMPLSLVECEADVKAGREVHTLMQPRALVALHGISCSPVKATVALFLAEVLEIVFRDGPADRAVWRYVAESITLFDALEAGRTANFYAVFLFGLARVLGIAPDTGGYRAGMVFDMAEGVFRQTAPLHGHYLTAADSAAVVTLSRLTYGTMHRWRISRPERRRILEELLRYYTLHYAAMGNLKSLDVVRTIF